MATRWAWPTSRLSARASDATFYLDLFQEDYTAVGTEFRYSPTQSSEGKFEAYVVDDPESEDLRWRYNWNHLSNELPLGLRAAVRFVDFSDFDFFRDFDRDLNRVTIRSLYSSAYIAGAWGAHSMNILVDDREVLNRNEAWQQPDAESVAGGRVSFAPNAGRRFAALFPTVIGNALLLDQAQAGSRQPVGSRLRFSDTHRAATVLALAIDELFGHGPRHLLHEQVRNGDHDRDDDRSDDRGGHRDHRDVERVHRRRLDALRAIVRSANRRTLFLQSIRPWNRIVRQVQARYRAPMELLVRRYRSSVRTKSRGSTRSTV